MNKEPINFKEQRELGDIISATFKFIRENYKSYFKSMIKIIWPAFLLLVAAVSFYSYSTIGSSLFMDGQRGTFFIGFGLLILALLIYYTVLNVAAFNFIKSYMKNKGGIIHQEIKDGVKKDLGKMLGLQAVSGILVIAGTMIFVLPGIYLSIPLAIAAAALVFKNESVGGSISEGFYLVKDNWWSSFISLFLIWLIVYVISLVFQLPLLIYSIIKMVTVMDGPDQTNISEVFDGVYLILTVAASAVQYILYAITPVGVAFVYYHLNEKKYATGAYESIDNLGKNE
ncbi:hypothetical protein SAMN05444483_101611 [Salegentibacter echinorum]|uniref:Membrane domain of glycerophosphoryl diester phosphodiesterase n=1 Tax=Salegentibacter echinorum TaxID=1073325 RepID=A0A1M5CPT6_SALEC|nr:hypothetical protein [Salegentibacter echinorum]SHF56607.1 hypothetical protein SAMN05444483_101611 [Salegentibacter echinorum]